MAKIEDGLTSLDTHGHRLEIIPAEVKGFFQKKRASFQFWLLAIFLILPWTKVNHVQTILFDIVDRKFSFFGIQLLSHDGPLIFLVFIILAVSLALMTCLWGRIWCGWACPQTVFIEGVYRKIERWIEGNYIQRRTLRQQPLSFHKAWKWVAKWISFTVVSSLFAHSFVAYFAGSEKLIEMINGSPTQNWSYFLLVTSMTGILLFNFGWFREQFCIVMCPYGRFQSVLMDSQTRTVIYDSERGEPRKGTPHTAKAGDCVSCRRCVQVCPTGIDIRNGVQMECIGCTACIDACNEIMQKIKKPKNLIGYSSLAKKTNFLRPRVLIYLSIIVSSGMTLGFNLIHRSPFMAVVMRASDMPYQVLNIENRKLVLNHFKIHFHNQKSKTQDFEIALQEAFLKKGFEIVSPETKFSLPPLSERELHFFIRGPESELTAKGSLELSIEIKSDAQAEKVIKVVSFLGPQVQ